MDVIKQIEQNVNYCRIYVVDIWRACVLSYFRHVRLSATPWTMARQAPLSLGVSRQEYWSGAPFPPPGRKYEVSEVKLLSRVRLCDPMDCSPPGSSIHGVFQGRVLEWGATSFSGYIALTV